ncbi:MAG TPA: serine/threonine-protein kinase [Polyangiaceae bacterium]|nr:serine/threonine-protein kinase [Polyangiaceae bacterium]
MSEAARERRGVRAPLEQALEEQIRRLELVYARVWQALAGLGLAGGLIYSLGEGGRLGQLAAATSGVFLCWYTAYAYLLGRGKDIGRLPLVAGILEGLLPWIFLIVVTTTQGAEYALGSWLPPLVYAAVILTATAKLRPTAPVLLGVSGAVAFMVLYGAYLRPRLAPESLEMPLFGWKMQVIRASSIMIGSLLATFVTRALRNAIGRAERTVRERDLFGKYQLEEKIASGGMGVVHRAVYCPEGGFVRTVAVKLLHAHLAEQTSFLSAFRSEAEISARLVHPNVVQVLDFGRVGGAYFLAMEFVDGLTLATIMRRVVGRRRALEEPLVAWIGHGLLAGLQYTHATARDPEGKIMRVVHRDLCPANILVSKSGEVKISDFGIARALKDRDTSQTRTVAGHLGYMAPEQARAAALDERCDLFAVGVILWELLAARPLFYRGAEAPTLLALMAGDVEPITAVRPGALSGWDAFFAKALARAPEDRFSSASEMDAALAQVVGSFPGDLTAVLASLVAWAVAEPDPDRTESPRDLATDLDDPQRDAATWVRPASGAKAGDSTPPS